MRVESVIPMSTELPHRPEIDEINPYAPPASEINEELVELVPAGDLAAAEATRRALIGHEAAVKSIGSLHFLGAFFGILGVVGMTVGALSRAAGARSEEGFVMLVGALAYVMVSGLHLALGIGL